MPGHLNGFSLAYTAVGGVVLWSGIKGTTISATFRGLLSGQAPSNGSETISTGATTSTGSTSSTGSTTAVGSGSASYTGSGLQALWTSNGGAQDTAAMAEAVGEAESGGSATVTSSNPDGGTNVGIWQLDTRGVGAGYTVAQLQNPNTNARITIMATNNGRNWSEWGDPVTAQLPGHQYTPGSPVPG
jgi:Lysozyme like domain